MQFKHPELLYALFLLIIPIIVHLFQLRRFQKVEFTNVQFLKTVIMQTRKSSQLKKWLTLLTRLLLFATIIMAFAQPFYSKSSILNTKVETVMYLDNSFSMQTKGDKGELLQRAIQDLIANVDAKQEITLFTNNNTYRNTTIDAIKNDLLQLDYTSNQLDYNAVLLKGQQLFSNDASSIKNFVLLSDFQDKNNDFKLNSKFSENIFLVKLNPINTRNIGVDSVYIDKFSATQLDLAVKLNVSDNTDISNTPVSLFEDDNLIAKTAINPENNMATFSLPSNQKINGKITVDDSNLQFDNTLFFSINAQENINVLAIHNTKEDDYLSRIFTTDEFNYTSVYDDALNYNIIDQQNLIILNELDNLPLSLINALISFKSNGGQLLIIPSDKGDLNSYNQVLNKIKFDQFNTSEKKITTINYSHPIFNNVFDKEVTNFQYPKVNSYFSMNTPRGVLLQFEDEQPFLLQDNNTFIFTAALNTKNSNFKNSPLIVPTLYNIGLQSLQLPNLYYTIGKENSFDANVSIQQDDILRFKNEDSDIIPRQQTFTSKVTITTNETPSIAATYNIVNASETIQHVSYNYNRNESDLNYLDDSVLNTFSRADSVPELMNNLKSDLNINALWKWFVIFALVLLIIEMLILNYFK